MEKEIANYKVFITKDHQTGLKKTGYVAYVPKLGIADDGYTIEEALENIKSLMKFHLKCLIEEQEPIPPPDSEETIVTSATITLTPIQMKKVNSLLI